MTISLCRLVVVDTAFAHFADTATIHTTLGKLFLDVIRFRSTERIVDRYGAGCTVGSTSNRHPQMVCFSHSC